MQSALADTFEQALTAPAKLQAAAALRELVGETTIRAYVDRVRAALGALPQELRFISLRESKPVVFESIPAATKFLKSPKFDFSSPAERYLYEITYSDGTEFERAVDSLEELRSLHREIERLAQHVTALMRG